MRRTSPSRLISGCDRRTLSVVLACGSGCPRDRGRRSRIPLQPLGRLLDDLGVAGRRSVEGEGALRSPGRGGRPMRRPPSLSVSLSLCLGPGRPSSWSERSTDTPRRQAPRHRRGRPRTRNTRSPAEGHTRRRNPRRRYAGSRKALRHEQRTLTLRQVESDSRSFGSAPRDRTARRAVERTRLRRRLHRQRGAHTVIAGDEWSSASGSEPFGGVESFPGPSSVLSPSGSPSPSGARASVTQVKPAFGQASDRRPATPPRAAYPAVRAIGCWKAWSCVDQGPDHRGHQTVSAGRA